MPVGGKIGARAPRSDEDGLESQLVHVNMAETERKGLHT